MTGVLRAEHAFYRPSGLLVGGGTGAGLTACTPGIDVRSATARFEACTRATAQTGVFILAEHDVVQLVRIWTATGAEGNRPALHGHLVEVRHVADGGRASTVSRLLAAPPFPFVETGSANLDVLELEPLGDERSWLDSAVADVAASVFAVLLTHSGRQVFSTGGVAAQDVLGALSEALGTICAGPWSIAWADGIAAVSPAWCTLTERAAAVRPAPEWAQLLARWVLRESAAPTGSLDAIIADIGRADTSDLPTWARRVGLPHGGRVAWRIAEIAARLRRGDAVDPSALMMLDEASAQAIVDRMDVAGVRRLDITLGPHPVSVLDRAIGAWYDGLGRADGVRAITAGQPDHQLTPPADIPRSRIISYGIGLMSSVRLTSATAGWLLPQLRAFGAESVALRQRLLASASLTDLHLSWEWLNHDERAWAVDALRARSAEQLPRDAVRAVLSRHVVDTGGHALVRALLDTLVRRSADSDVPLTLWDVLAATPPRAGSLPSASTSPAVATPLRSSASTLPQSSTVFNSTGPDRAPADTAPTSGPGDRRAVSEPEHPSAGSPGDSAAGSPSRSLPPPPATATNAPAPPRGPAVIRRRRRFRGD